MDPLRQDLCRLAMALEPSSIRLLLAGGYGILLKAEYLVHTGAETVASTSFPRATRDLDLVLTSEIIADAGKLTTVREALKHLGYEPLAGREHYQWGRVTEDEGRETPIKIDLMGQIPEDRRGMSIRARRMRPHGFKGLHAHPMKEADPSGGDPHRRLRGPKHRGDRASSSVQLHASETLRLLGSQT